MACTVVIKGPVERGPWSGPWFSPPGSWREGSSPRDRSLRPHRTWSRRRAPQRGQCNSSTSKSASLRPPAVSYKTMSRSSPRAAPFAHPARKRPRGRVEVQEAAAAGEPDAELAVYGLPGLSALVDYVLKGNIVEECGAVEVVALFRRHDRDRLVIELSWSCRVFRQILSKIGEWAVRTHPPFVGSVAVDRAKCAEVAANIGVDPPASWR